MNPLQDQDPDRIIFFTLCGLSIIAELFIIISYLSIRRRTNAFYNQVIWLCGTDLICFISYFYSLSPNLTADTGCKIFGFINEFSHVSSITWTSIIAITIFYSMRTQQRIASIPLKYTIIANVISFIFPLYPLVLNEYGMYDGFGFPLCWILQQEFTTLIIAYWVPLVLTLIFNFCCYISIMIYLRKRYSGSISDFGVLFVFPLVQMLSNSGSLLYSLSYIQNTAPSMRVQLFHAITRSVEGLLNVVAYGSNYSVRNELRKAWCTKRKKDETFANKSINMPETGTPLFMNLTYPSLNA